MPKPSVFPTSFAQRRLWFIQNMSPQSTAYNMVFSVPLSLVPDSAALRGALRTLVSRHESLRTSFSFANGQPLQVIAVDCELPLAVIDHGHSAAERTAEFRRRVSASVSRPFDLSRSPLVRMHLGILGDGRSELTLVAHHIIADGVSLRVLAEDLDTAYWSHASGRIAILPELGVQYADYAVWQRRMLSGARLERLAGYWRKRLDGISELDLRLDRPRPPVGGTRGAVHPFTIPPDVVRRLKSLAADSGTTLFATLLTGFSAMLGRFTGQSSVAVGIPVSGRPRPELERVVGLFVNAIVFRAELSGNPTLRHLLHRVSTDLAEDLSHQDYPFELLVDALKPKRRADRNPIFQLMFQLQLLERTSRPVNLAGELTDGPSEERSAVPLEPDAVTSQLDLSFIQYETVHGQIDGGAVYNADLFEPDSIEQLVDAYLLIIAEFSRNASARVAEVAVMREGRLTQTLALGTGPRRDWTGSSGLHDWFVEQAEAEPTTVAVAGDRAPCTFAHLHARSNAIGSSLRRMGVGRGKVVALCLPRRGARLVETVLGVLKAGGAYVYLDPNAPSRWIELIISDCDAAVVAVPRDRQDLAFGRQRLVPEEIQESGTGEQFGRVCVSVEDPAYLIYTSGSTGRPKGVLVSHRAIVNHMRWMLERFPLGPGDRVLQRTPLSFDASVWELFAPLLSGATLVLAPEARLFDPEVLLEQIVRDRITTLQVVPSLLRTLVHGRGLARCTSLTRVFCGGEPLTSDVRDSFFSESSAELCNLYGPTEATIDATFHACDRSDPRAFVPIGRPIANVAARVLDEHGAPVPLGVAGELYLGGAAVAIGYLGRPSPTAERFLPDPDARGLRRFRTGDRVRMLPGGDIEFMGRLDEQVKVRGHRIEPGEIETVLVCHPSVREAAVVVQDHGVGDQRLVAFLVPQAHAESDLTLVQDWLADRLPDYLVPSAIEIKGSLPKTDHGKINRAALERLRVSPDRVDRTRTAPRNNVERTICRQFEDVLGIDEVGIDDSFFRLGGHSLLIVTLQERLAASSGVDVSVVDVFEFPTPRQLAEELEARALSEHVAEKC